MKHVNNIAYDLRLTTTIIHSGSIIRGLSKF